MIYFIISFSFSSSSDKLHADSNCFRTALTVSNFLTDSSNLKFYSSGTIVLFLKGAMSPLTHARANENKLEKVGPTFSSSVGDFGRLFLSV